MTVAANNNQPRETWAHDLEALIETAQSIRSLGRAPTPEEAAALERTARGLRASEPESTVLSSLWQPVGLEALTVAPPLRRWLLRHPTKDWQPVDLVPGDGMLPLGKAGVLAAEGGAGKTQALVQLAVSLVTGRPWLDYFRVSPEARGRGVLLALAEEDAEEAKRRPYDIARAMKLSRAELELVASQIVILPLAGVPVALLRRGALGAIEESPELAELRRLLAERAPTQGWALVALDPLSRWAGPDAEKDNEAATRTVQALESLTAVPGQPTVLVAAHSSKIARRSGSVDTRGVTAITDGLRWEGQLRVDDAAVYFRQAKSNYSRPMPESRAVQLVRDADGVLRALSTAELRERQQESREDDAVRASAQLDADVQRVVAALLQAGECSSIDHLVGLTGGMRTARGRTAVREAIRRELIGTSGTSRATRYQVTPKGVPLVRVSVPPYTPGTSGRPGAGRPETSDGVRDDDGTSWDDGTSF